MHDWAIAVALIWTATPSPEILKLFPITTI
jgi:hypothetical protein